MTPRRTQTLIFLLAAAIGCGELETPDLEHGNVWGRVQGAVAGGFVYPLGAPQQKVALAADGGFELVGVPVGTARLVVFDGDSHAEVAEVVVSGGSRTRLDRDAATMALAGRVVLTVVPTGGVLPSSPRYSVKGTNQSGVTSAAGAAVLFPLPAGSYELEADMDGYLPGGETLDVTAGATAATQVVLEIGGGAAPGCVAAGGACRNGLHCDATDGRCVQCRVGGTDCPAGATCDPATRFCAAAASGGAICSVCTQGGDCAGGYCEKAAGAAPTDPGYCTRTSGCPAGFTIAAAGPSRCVAPQGCGAYFQVFGQSCFDDTTCGAAQGLQGGVCRSADEDHGSSGYCTAPCSSDADCVVGVFTLCSTSHHCAARRDD